MYILRSLLLLTLCTDALAQIEWVPLPSMPFGHATLFPMPSELVAADQLEVAVSADGGNTWQSRTFPFSWVGSARKLSGTRSGWWFAAPQGTTDTGIWVS